MGQAGFKACVTSFFLRVAAAEQAQIVIRVEDLDRVDGQIQFPGIDFGCQVAGMTTDIGDTDIRPMPQEIADH